MYFAVDNKLNRIDSTGTLATNIAPTIPSSYYITSIDVSGVYLTATLSPTSNQDSSQVYLIDVDIDDPAPVSVIDFGTGNILHGGSIGRIIWGIIDTSYSLAIRYWQGGDEAKTFLELKGTINSSGTNTFKKSIGTKLYFSVSLSSNNRSSTALSGIWCIGQNSNEEWQVSVDTIDSNLTTDTVDSFDVIGKYKLFSTTSMALHVSNSETTPSGIGTWVSTKISADKIGKLLQLKQYVLRTEPLPTSGSISLYYRVDEDTSWTLINTESTLNNVVTQSTDYDGSGANFKKGYEYQFKIVSTRAVVTGLYCNFDEDNE